MTRPTASPPPVNPRSLFQPELLPGERLLWTGQPSARIVFHPSDWIAVPASILFALICLLWEFNVIAHFFGHPGQHRARLLQALIALPFLLLSQYLLWGRFFHTAWKKHRTFYALTSKRILVLRTSAVYRIGTTLHPERRSGLDRREAPRVITERDRRHGPDRRVIDGYISTLDSISLITSGDHLGTIEFAHKDGIALSVRRYNRRRSVSEMNLNLDRLAFHDIDGARNVYQLVQAERQRALGI